MANLIQALKMPFLKLGQLWPRRSAPIADEAREEDATNLEIGDLDETVITEAVEEQPAAQPGWKQRLRGWLSRLALRKRDREAEESADAGEEAPAARTSWKQRLRSLFARLALRKRDQAEEPAEQDAATIKRGSLGNEIAFDDEGQLAKPSFFARAKKLLGGTPAKIIYFVLVVAVLVAAAQYEMMELVRQQNQAIEELRIKNAELDKEKSELEKQNQEIAERQAQAQTQAQAQAGAAAGAVTGSNAGAGMVASGTAGDDCAVGDAASAGATLKRCIQQYNAASGR